MHFNIPNPYYNGNFLCAKIKIYNHHLKVGREKNKIKQFVLCIYELSKQNGRKEKWGMGEKIKGIKKYKAPITKLAIGI